MAPTRWVVALILGCLLLAATVVNSFRIRDKSSSSAEVSKEVPFQKVRLDIIKRDPGKTILKNEPEIKVKQIPVKQKTHIVEDTKFSSKVITLKPSLDLSKVEKPILAIKKPVVSFKISKKDDDDDDDDDEDEDEEDSDNSDKSEASETESDLSDTEDSDDNNKNGKNVNIKKKNNINKDDDDSDDNDDDDSDNDDKDNNSDNNDSDDDDEDEDDDDSDDDDEDEDDDESDEDEDSETDTEKKKNNNNSKSKRNISDNDDESEDDNDDDDDDKNSDKEDTSDDEKNIESESDSDNENDDDDNDTDDSGSDTENRKNKSKTDGESDIDKSDDEDDDTDNDDKDDDSDDNASDSDMSEKDDDNNDDSDAEKSNESDKGSETDETSDSESETIKIGSKFKLKTVIPPKPQATIESLKHKISDIKPSTNKIDPVIISSSKSSGKEASELKKPQEKVIPKKLELIKIDPPSNKIDIQKDSPKKQSKEEKLPKKTDTKPVDILEVKKDIVPDIKKQSTPSAKPPQLKPISEPQKDIKKEIHSPQPTQSKSISEPQKVIKKEIPTKPAPPTPKPKQTEDKKDKDVVKKDKIVKDIKESKTKKPQKSTNKRAERAPGVLRRKNMHASDFDDFYAFFPTFAPNFSRIHNPECRRHGQILIRQLRGAKIWTLQMLDSTAKIPSGLLRGNGNQLGDFDQCLGTKARVKLDSGSIVKVSGKYCLAQIDIKPINDEARLAVHLAQARSFIRSTYNDPGHFIPRFTTLNWGVCLPASCEAEDAEFIIRDSLRHYNGTTGLKININVDPVNCYENNSDPWYEEWLDIPTILTLSLYTIVICVIAYATTKDYLIYGEKPSNEEETNESIDKSEDNEETEKADENKEKEEEEEMKKEDNEEGKSEEEPKNEESGEPSTLVLAFSLKQSVGKLLREGSAEGDIECIHGIRALCSIALYIAHKLIPLGMMPFTNRSYLTEVSNSQFSSALRASLLYTDTFLLLSGVLTAYHMSQDIDKTGSIPWLKRYIARYIRLTPAVVAVLLWYAWISDKLGEGPMWGIAVTQNAELCQQNLWQNIFYIQNFFPFEEMCAPHTHQLALDMQLWWLAPFSVWMLRSKPMMALPVLGILHSMAVYLRYSAALGNHLSLVIYHGITVRQLFRTANLCYTLSLHRATPYLAGIGLGVLLQQFTKEVTLPKLLYIPGWLISLYFGCWAIYTPAHMALRDYQYNANEAAQYAALASVAWALALSWVIFACFTGAGGVINKLLCSRPLVVISRISYCMYLCQFLIFFYNVGSARSSSEFTISHGINVLEVISVLTASVILTLLFDIPMQTLRVSIMSIEIKSSNSEETGENETENQPEGEQNLQDVEENSTETRVEEVTREVIYEEDEEGMMIHHDVEQDIIYEEEEEEIAEGEGEPEYEYEEEIVWVEEEVEEEEEQEEEEEPENKEKETVIQEIPEEGGSQEELEDWEWTNENSTSGGTNQFYNYRRW